MVHLQRHSSMWGTIERVSHAVYSAVHAIEEGELRLDKRVTEWGVISRRKWQACRSRESELRGRVGLKQK